MSSRSRLVGIAGVSVILAFGLDGCHTAGSAGAAPQDPLDPIPVLRSNGDYLIAQDESQRFLVGAFRKFEAGISLTTEDRTNLLKGARLCAAMSAYLPGKAEAQDFTCGEALTALGYHEEAIHRYQLFLAYAGDNPADPIARVARADSYRMMSVSLTALGRYKAALDAINVALKAYPQTAAYHVDRASAEMALGDLAAAKADLAEAVSFAASDDPAKGKAQGMLKALSRKQ